MELSLVLQLKAVLYSCGRRRRRVMYTHVHRFDLCDFMFIWLAFMLLRIKLSPSLYSPAESSNELEIFYVCFNFKWMGELSESFYISVIIKESLFDANKLFRLMFMNALCTQKVLNSLSLCFSWSAIPRREIWANFSGRMCWGTSWKVCCVEKLWDLFVNEGRRRFKARTFSKQRYYQNRFLKLQVLESFRQSNLST